MNIKKIILIFFLTFVSNVSWSQVSTYTFIDPCTKEVTIFSVPLQGGKTTIIFLNNVGSFDANDLSSGVFSNWVNQVYTTYRQTNPCSQQQGQVTQNQITAQIIGSTVQSVVSSILSSSQSQSVSVESGSSSSDAGGKDNKDSEKKKNNNSQGNGSGNSQGNTSNNSSTQGSGQSQSTSGNNNTTGNSNGTQGSGNSTSGGGSTGSSNPTQGGGSTTQPSVGSQGGSTSSGNSGNNGGTSGSGNSGGSGSSSGNNGGTSGSGSTGGNGSNTGGGTTTNGGTTGNNNQNGTQQQGEEVGATTQMNNDAHNDNNAGGSGGSNGGGKGKSGNGGNARSNPIIVSSDLTSAQNLNKSFTPIVNIGTSKSSMTGLSSYGITGMVWLNFQQFALSAKYTKIHYSKTKKLKFIHNLNLTGVYTYGNYLGFIGYSGILNGGKYGITGFNISGAATIISEEKNGYYSPSITAFYTRPFKAGKKIILSPELYIISTPLVYSSKDKVSISDRYVSGFIGTGIDYQISKRFKLNVNYKANMSTNPEFPILSFFLIGSKINL